MDKELRELILKYYGDIDKLEASKRTGVFFELYYLLVTIMERDFDFVTELQIAEITFDKNKALKDANITNIKSDNPQSGSKLLQELPAVNNESQDK